MSTAPEGIVPDLSRRPPHYPLELPWLHDVVPIEPERGLWPAPTRQAWFRCAALDLPRCRSIRLSGDGASQRSGKVAGEGSTTSYRFSFGIDGLPAPGRIDRKAMFT